MAFDNRFIDELKMRVNIVDVIGREVSLKRTGSNYKGLCPFHGEKTPSFNVNENGQYYHCFGCGETGDAIRFVEKYYNLSFMDAVEKLRLSYLKAGGLPGRVAPETAARAIKKTLCRLVKEEI